MSGLAPRLGLGAAGFGALVGHGNVQIRDS